VDWGGRSSTTAENTATSTPAQALTPPPTPPQCTIGDGPWRGGARPETRERKRRAVPAARALDHNGVGHVSDTVRGTCPRMSRAVSETARDVSRHEGKQRQKAEENPYWPRKGTGLRENAVARVATNEGGPVSAHRVRQTPWLMLGNEAGGGAAYRAPDPKDSARPWDCTGMACLACGWGRRRKFDQPARKWPEALRLEREG
jgi:hypothetical protein